MGVSCSIKKNKKIERRLSLLQQTDKNNDIEITNRCFQKNKNLIVELENSKKQIMKMKKIIQKDKMKKLSKIRIQEFVQKLIQHEQLDINWLPEYVEKQIYFNVVNIVTRLLTDTLDETDLDLFAHKIKFIVNV
tara:strand:+ start:809 stop:1210 length:402 start_codon:yes stop_codon:yes gene_type:complete